MSTEEASTPGEGATARFAAWVSALRPSDIPDDVLHHIKLCLLDSLGCGLFGSRQECGRITAAYARAASPGGPASLWGAGDRCGPADAALANGTAVHGFEIDDIHLRSLLHPGAVTVPAALAVAEARASSGSALLTALVAGYEVGLRVGICAGVEHQLRGFHPTGTAGALCSSAAVASLLKLAPDAATHALAIGATQAAGLYCAARSGAMVKRMHAGHAAQAGVIGAMLAERGFTGSPDALEAPYGGFMVTLSDNGDITAQLTGLGKQWETTAVGFKIYAACASAHTIVDAVGAMAARGMTADNLAALEIRMSKSAMNNVGWKYQPAGLVAAQMNGYYAAAVRLLDGDAFIDQYSEHRLADPRILRLIDRIRLVHEPELDTRGAAGRHAIRAQARLSDGRVLDQQVDQRRGSTTHPLHREEIEHKFLRTAASALPAASAESILELVMSLESEADVRRLGELLRGGRVSAAAAA